MVRDFIISAVSAMVGGLISVVIMACILVNRYKTSQELKAELLTKRWLDLCKEKQTEEEAQKQRTEEIQKWGQKKPKVNVVPMWHHQHGGGDSDGHA